MWDEYEISTQVGDQRFVCRLMRPTGDMYFVSREAINHDLKMSLVRALMDTLDIKIEKVSR